MLRVPNKSIFFSLLLMLTSGHAVSAQTKVYQYDGKLPFVQMMLNMMAAMGILDRLPTNGAYGGAPGFGNQFMSTPWSSSIGDYSNMSGASPVWGSPSWGVLPTESYASNYYQGYDRRALSPAWSSTDLDGWVNETWESSSWNPEAEAPVQSMPAQTSPQANVPLVQNFNYNVPNKPADNQQQNIKQNRRRNNNVNNRSPLAKLSPQNRSTRPQKKQSPLPKKSSNNIRQKPCITDFCGLKKPDLDGLWVAQNGEMLGVKNHRYLWSDNNSRYLTGQLKVQNEYLVANVDGHDKIMRFKYKLAGNHLLTLQPDGKIREFTRTRNNQYRGQNYSSDYY